MSAEGSGARPRLRGLPRAATDVVVEIHDAGGTSLRGICRLLEVGVTGACVESTSELNEGDALVLKVLLDSDGPLALPATVVWKKFFVRLYRYGLHLNALSPETRGAIERFVAATGARLKRMGPAVIHTAEGYREV